METGPAFFLGSIVLAIKRLTFSNLMHSYYDIFKDNKNQKHGKELLSHGIIP